jgi:hypothetical protein
MACTMRLGYARERERERESRGSRGQREERREGVRRGQSEGIQEPNPIRQPRVEGRG